MNTSTYFFLFLSIAIHAMVFTPVGSILFDHPPTQNIDFTRAKSSFQVLLRSRKISAPPSKAAALQKKVANKPQRSKPILPSRKQLGVRQKVKKLALSPPEYPEESRLYGEEGEVVVGVKINEQGKPERVSLISSSGYERLDQSVLKKIAQTHFSGQEKEELELSFKFELQD